MKRIYFIFIVFFFSCKDCKLDEKLKSDFEYNLNLIIDWEHSEIKAVSQDDYLDALTYMNKTTGHTSGVSLGYFGAHYSSIEVFQQDIKAWEQWYDKNKCIR